MVNHMKRSICAMLMLCISVFTLSACSLGEGTADESQSIAEMFAQMDEDISPIEPASSGEYNSKENAARPCDFTFEGDTYIKVNSNVMFDQIFGRGNYTLEELYSVIDKNKSIPKEYKDFFKKYFKELTDYYPDLELRVFAYNLKDVEMQFISEYDIHQNGGENVYAMYDYENNVIMLRDTLDYQNEYWDLISLRHEIAHMRNYFQIEKGEYKYTYRFYVFCGEEGSVGATVDEVLTVMFSTDPYYEEYINAGIENMGYPLATNELRVIVDAIDYSPADSVSHNMYLLEDRMNDVMGDKLDSHIIMKTFDRQQRENINQEIQQNDPEYEALFDYIACIYMTKYVNESMSYAEIMDRCEVLKDKLLTGVHNPEYVYTDVVDSAFSKYCEEHGITD